MTQIPALSSMTLTQRLTITPLVTSFLYIPLTYIYLYTCQSSAESVSFADDVVFCKFTHWQLINKNNEKIQEKNSSKIQLQNEGMIWFRMGENF